MKRPVIGITMDRSDKPERYGLHHDYADAVEAAGGLPLAIPYRTDLSLVPQIVDLLDGIVFTGGDDLDPALYGEERHPKAIPLDARRQQFELALVAEVDRRRMPALGICLGSQVMNIHRGGTLYQFLPDLPREGALEHRKLDADSRRHPVRLMEDSLLARTLGKLDIDTNTSHKQAVKTVGRGLRIIAMSPDGIIEGVEDPDRPLFMGVQWHPERLYREPDHLVPFRLLVERAGR